jgi:DNA-binding response OmpR family regulator
MFDRTLVLCGNCLVADALEGMCMRFSTPRILLADPDAATLAVFEELLHHDGYATLACQTARLAHRLIEAEHPDLLIVNIDLDWHGAGFDVIVLLRQERRTAALPIIVCADDQPELRMYRRQLAACNCFILVQPVDEAALLMTIQAALESRLQSRAVGG